MELLDGELLLENAWVRMMCLWSVVIGGFITIVSQLHVSQDSYNIQIVLVNGFASQ